MVLAEISPLSKECTVWRENLRNYREELIQGETKLQQAVSKPLSKEQLQEVEHLHNQFDIQLINIHDLKKSIKVHADKIEQEKAGTDNGVIKESVARHEILHQEYNLLDQTLMALRRELETFLNNLN